MAKKSVNGDRDTLSMLLGGITGFLLTAVLTLYGTAIGFIIISYLTGRFENRFVKVDVFGSFFAAAFMGWLFVIKG